MDRKRGFTLVEVIIAIAILSVVMVSAFRLMTTVVNQYSKDNDSIRLQSEVEEMITLLEDIVIDADSVTINDDGSIYVYQGNDYYHVYQAANELYYQRYSRETKTSSYEKAREEVYLGTYVQSVTFTLSEKSTALFVDLSMRCNQATYEVSRKILLRNMTKDYGAEVETVEAATTSTTAADSGSGSGSGEQESTTTTTAEETTTTTTAEETTTTAAETTTVEETTTQEETTTSSTNKLIITDASGTCEEKEYAIDFVLKNEGENVNLNNVKIYYYFTTEQNRTVEIGWHATHFSNDNGNYWDENKNNYTIKNMSTKYAGATQYVEAVSNRGGNLKNGESIRFFVKLHYQNWPVLNLTDKAAFDKSYSGLGAGYIVVKVGDKIVWGTEPNSTNTANIGNSSAPKIKKDGFGYWKQDNSERQYQYYTQVVISNYKNVDSSKLKVRYYFYLNSNYDNNGITIETKEMPSSYSYKISKADSSKYGENMYCVEFYNMTISEWFKLDFYICCKKQNAGDTNKCYSKDLNTIEFVYDGAPVILQNK